jgi:hypothetical protein
MQNLVDIKQMINIKNFMLVGNDVPYDPNYYDTIKDFCVLIRPNVSQPTQQAQKVNMIIKKWQGTT